ncbi:MAG: Flp pilus assembly complex ATPase component TadA [Fusobacteriales bacterium]|jgi:type IV secretion system protein VirB11|nr:Flp pilus assembly complex ATPase component TadA [Fusobacteriales bacterium]
MKNEEEIIKNNYALQKMSKIHKYLLNDDVTEIMLNVDGYVRIEDNKRKYKTDIHFNEDESMLIIRAVTSENKKEMSRDKNSIISGILATGDRFEGISGQESKNKTIFCIRKKARKIYTLNDYVESQIISEEEKEYIVHKIKERKNILIIGGTGSGKTTFINACLNEFSSSETRFIILEDTDEIQCSAPDTVKLESSEKTTMSKLMQSCMRLRPDIIIVGEMRSGEEVLSLLEAWNTGHNGGLSTVHANNCIGGIYRLQQLLMNHNKIVPQHSASFIANSVDILINIQKVEGRRKITEIAEIQGYDYTTNEFKLQNVKGGQNGNSIL